VNKRPNILLVVLDDLGIGQFAPVARQLELEDIDPSLLAYTDALDEDKYDKQVALDCARRAMPFLTSLSEKSITCSRAFATSSLCAPSRQGLLTGCNQTRWGAYRNIDVNVCGLKGQHCLVREFQKNGYRTGLIGKWHAGSRDHALQQQILDKGGSEEDVWNSGYWGSVCERDHPLNHGFDHAFFYNRWECDFYDSRLIWENRSFTGHQQAYNTDLFADKALEFMRGSLDSGQPFFTELALQAVHIPLNVDAPEPYAREFQTGYKSIDQFYAHVYAADQAVARIAGFLKERGEWDNTVLFFISDNGATCKVGGGDLSLIPGNGPYKGHKGNYYQGGIRVPLMVSWPDKFKEAVHIAQAVSLMDVLPTALDAAGLPQPDGIDGRSLLGAVDEVDNPLHDQLIFTGIHAPSWGYTEKRVIGSAQERRDEFPGAWVIVEGDWLLRFVGRLDAGLVDDAPDGREPYFSLFNIKEDPIEQIDRIADEPELARRLTAAYMAHARTLPPPHTWDRNRWEELMPEDHPLRGGIKD
jgi:uncharacterized sulfatase